MIAYLNRVLQQYRNHISRQPSPSANILFGQSPHPLRSPVSFRLSPSVSENYRQSFEDAIDEDLIVECVRSIRIDMPACGGRKIKELLRKEFGLDVGRDKLFEILERHNLLIKPRRKRARTTFSDHCLTVYADLRKEPRNIALTK